jgi:uncharacterized protein YggE
MDGRFGPAPKGAVLIVIVALIAALAVPANALTQGAAQAPTQGITVIGYGKSSAPAETAEIQMVATLQEFGGPRPPDPDATPGAQERESVESMVQGLQDVGVAEEDIEVVVGPAIGAFYGPGGPGVARVDVAVEAPTQERITELINAGIVGAAEENLVLSLIGVGYAVADCAPLERDAREAAFNDARTRGELQAELMGLPLGEAVAASDVPINFSQALNTYYGPVTPTQVPCSPPAPAPTGGSPVSVPPFDPTDGAEVNVYAQVAVTFEIGTDAEATPAT